ncbi:MAG: hypothetical protein COU07_01070 [Candidatus Harrisonbacteria bacterium CG10_big_fil_rev_8_21_14_0_10_40_38]|uniref:Uncharacterized protein n=1 Tax=Candidatus Harrisonbacteria bacterium CG10_big_fil_rev_8_21_14_0_10_40_38 TaxID=1974583 RepID=A0A2H0UUN9_9BACT|nr:MAG: hypothetical protein COU07_01070 [Candidatus Harrisonbacteria bacterium CG10_big_fil_rev_8_21_14_0_10_40_38]
MTTKNSSAHVHDERFKKLLENVKEAQKNSGVDLSTEEDLSLAVMNLISLEEHFFFTGVKTHKPEYFDLLNEVRSLRKDLLGTMISAHEGETWCISKHLLAATMRLIEVGTKLQSDGLKEKAKNMFDRAYRTYSLFWAVRLKLVSIPHIDDSKAGDVNNKNPWDFEDLISKLVDCCDEK